MLFRVLLCLALLCITPLQASENTQDKLSSIKEQIKSNKRLIAPKKKAREKAIVTLGKINRNIKFNSLKIVHIQKELEESIANEKKSKHELEQKEAEFDALSNQFSKRLVSIYKLSPVGLIDILLTDDDWVLNSDSAYFFSKILKEDAKLIERIKKQHRQLQQKRKELIKKTTERLALKRELEESKRELVLQNKDQNRYIRQLDADIKRLISQNKQLERLSKELSDLIKKEELNSQFLASGSFILPVNGWISSRFGMRKHPIFKRKIKHTGIDIAAPKGYKVRAANSGKVIFSGTKGGYGKSILIYHGKRQKDGKSVSTFYAHQSRLLVKKGDKVIKGDEIGWVGSTGFATGPHLHFEVKLAGVPVDPLRFVPTK